MRNTLPSSTASRAPAPTEGSRKEPVQGTNGELPQFPGVVFGARGIDLDHEAETNEAAIRASLIHFKHRWPGQTVVLEGSDAFRLKVWAIAEEVGVPLHGPRPGSGDVVLHRQGSARWAGQR
jgi:hypothetical protein